MNHGYSSPNQFGSTQDVILPQLNLDSSERQFYQQCFEKCSPDYSDRIEALTTAEFLKKSGLHKDILETIWTTATNRFDSISKEEFFAIVRLICFAQNGIEPSLDNITKVRQIPLPLFEGINFNSNSQGRRSLDRRPTIEEFDDRLKVNPNQIKKFEEIYKLVDPQKKGFVTQETAADTMKKSGLGNEVLFQIWLLCDQGDKGNLDKAEFVLALHLMDAAKRSIPIPKKLPNELDKFLKEYRSGSFNAQPRASLIDPQPVQMTQPRGSIVEPKINNAGDFYQESTISFTGNTKAIPTVSEFDFSSNMPSKPSVNLAQPYNDNFDQKNFQSTTNLQLSFSKMQTIYSEMIQAANSMRESKNQILSQKAEEVQKLEGILEHYQRILKKVNEENQQLEERIKELDAKRT